MKKEIENIRFSVSSFWFWGWLYFMLVQHWSFGDAFFWIYVLINKHL